MGYIVKAACAMVKVGDTYVTLAKGAAVPVNADADHVALLVDRGILVEGEPSGFEVDPNIPPPFKAPKEPPATLDAFPADGTEDEQTAWTASGSVASINAYVAEHPDQADAILAAEQRRDTVRTTLVNALTPQTGA